MNPDDIKRLFPNASASTLKRNAGGDAGVHPMHPQLSEKLPLHDSPAGEETRWYGASRCFEITFTVFAMQPCDWDGWDIKRLQDWCVKAGLIPGDGWNTLSGRVLSRKVSREAEERTEIEIKAL